MLFRHLNKHSVQHQTASQRIGVVFKETVGCRFLQNAFNDFHEFSSDILVHERKAILDKSHLGFVSGSVIFELVKQTIEDWQVLGLEQITHKSLGHFIRNMKKFFSNRLVENGYQKRDPVLFGEDFMLLVWLVFATS